MATLEDAGFQNFVDPKRDRVPRDFPIIMDVQSTRKAPNLSAFTDNPHLLGKPIEAPFIEPPRPPTSKPIQIRSPEMRPESALARGVQISDQSELCVNPEPIITEEADLLLEEYLSPRKLRLLTGVDDLTCVQLLEMKVDTRDTSLGNFGSHLPGLKYLKLSNSIISKIRDLGSSLDNLQVLWMARCGVEELDGLPSMLQLRELYLAYNEVNDISPCGMLEHLQILDLEGNNIDNITEVTFLCQCPKLDRLTLDGNPVCMAPSPTETDPNYDYRAAVRSIIPHLKYLDDELLLAPTVAAKPKRQTTSVFAEDWKLLEELMDEGVVPGSEELVVLDLPARPGTGVKPTTAYRPGSALKPYQVERSLRTASRAGPSEGRPASRGGLGVEGRPMSRAMMGSESVKRLGSSDSGSRPGTASRLDSAHSEDEHAASVLTSGTIVCGNPSKALHARRRTQKPTKLHDIPRLKKEFAHRPEHTHDTALEDDESVKEILAELKQWKVGYQASSESLLKAAPREIPTKAWQTKQAEIDASKAPQVLRIDHDESLEVSGNEISSDEDEEDVEICYKNPQTSPQSHENPQTSPQSEETLPSEAVTRPKEPSRSGAECESGLKVMASSHWMQEAHDEEETVAVSTAVPSMKLGKDKRQVLKPISLRSPSPVLLHPDDEARPYSGPEALGPRKYKVEPMDKTKPRPPIDKSNPIIRTEISTPERFMDGPRAGTSRAAVLQPPPQFNKIKKGQLTSVPLLPSKFAK